MTTLPPLNREFSCDCGAVHRIPIEEIGVGEDAVDALAAFLGSAGPGRTLVIDDTNTGPLLGDAVRRAVASARGKAEELRYPAEEHLRADGQALAFARRAIAAASADFVVAVGSGTLTDIARWASFEAGIPFVVMATAPSVDGFASTVAALQLDGVKVTRPAQAPRAIFTRPSVLAAAPWPLIQSGFGDLAGKITALMDWKLSVRLYDDAWCDEAYRLVADALGDLVASADALLARDSDAAGRLFSGLVRSGLAMAMVGSSRPASGAEHHLSHYWDYLTYRARRGYVGHGIQVGYATGWVLRAYERLQTLGPLKEPRLPALDRAWREDVRTRWGTGAEDVIRAQEEKLAWLSARWDVARWAGRTGSEIAASLMPEYGIGAAMRRVLMKMGLTEGPSAYDLTPAMIAEAMRYAREVRARYTVLDFLEGQRALTPLVEQILPAVVRKGDA